MHHPSAPQLPAIQPDVVRPDPVRQLVQQQKILVQLWNLQVQFPRLRVPVQRKQPILPLHPRNLLAQRLRPIRRPRRPRARQQNRQSHKRQHRRPHTKRPNQSQHHRNLAVELGIAYAPNALYLSSTHPPRPSHHNFTLTAHFQPAPSGSAPQPVHEFAPVESPAADIESAHTALPRSA